MSILSKRIYNSLDFERYAQEKAMKGAVAKSWIKPFEKYFLSQCSSYRDMRVLDYGFGDGRYFQYFIQYFDPQNVHGVEVSKIRVERARARGWQNTIYLNITNKLPYESNFFDFINMVEVIEHIPRVRVDFYLSELERVLRPDGMLILTTPNYPIKRVYDLLHAFRMKAWNRLKDDSTHVAFYNHKTLRNLLVRYFENVLFLAYKEGLFYRKWKAGFLCHKILAVCLQPKKHSSEHQNEATHR